MSEENTDELASLKRENEILKATVVQLNNHLISVLNGIGNCGDFLRAAIQVASYPDPIQPPVTNWTIPVKINQAQAVGLIRILNGEIIPDDKNIVV